MGFYGDERGCTVGYLLAIELLDMVHLVRLLMIFHGSAQKSATPNPLVNPSFYTMFLCKMQSLGGIPNVYAQANTYIYIYILFAIYSRLPAYPAKYHYIILVGQIHFFLRVKSISLSLSFDGRTTLNYYPSLRFLQYVVVDLGSPDINNILSR